MDVDRNGMLVLSREECVRRLGRTGLGRVAVTIGALPSIFPVNYATHAGDVFFRTAGGTKLSAAVRNAVVAFETDSVDRMNHTGWSVQVLGTARPVEDREELAALGDLPLARWIGGGPDTLVRVCGDLVSGREITWAAPRRLEDEGNDPALSTCPACGNASLVAVSDGELTNFVCTRCFACWHRELTSLYRIPVDSCPGCRLAAECDAAHVGAP